MRINSEFETRSSILFHMSTFNRTNSGSQSARYHEQYGDSVLLAYFTVRHFPKNAFGINI